MSPYEYRVFETEKGTYLEVVFGSLAMYQRILKMSPDEIAEFSKDNLFAEDLAEKVRLDEHAFESRYAKPPL